jgi:aryl-alcohol dehydrogenase-like predicted oxidoreductase
VKYATIAGIDKPVSRLIHGALVAAGMGEAKAFELLDAVYALGCNAFDTAVIYGQTDRILGKWIRERGIRDKVVILAKGAHHNGDRRRVTPFDIASDMHDTLARMDLPSVDLYVLHRDDPDVPVGPIVEALNEHVREGRIQAFGGSNWSHARVKEANDYAAAHGLQPFSVTNPQYSLVPQRQEPWENCVSIGGPVGEEARAYYAACGIAVLSWSSLGAGFLAGRITRENALEWKEGYEEQAVRCYGSDESFDRLDRVREIAAAKGAEVAQIGMAFLMNQPMSVFALVGCKNADEMASSAAGLEIALTQDELDYLDLKRDSV